jgi:hypothetical protein
LTSGTNNFQIAGGPGPIVRAYHIEESPKFILPYLDLIEKNKLFRKNAKPFQVSFNYYPNSDFTLSPHKDSRGTQAIIISLGSPIGLDFYYHESNAYSILIGPGDFHLDPDGTALLEPGSLLLFSEDSFTKYLHGISGKTEDFITEKTLNADLISVKYGEKTIRGERISIAIWAD